ncbi:MAG: hypothetical protein JW772_05445 [Candidatus Diapherotrites archaeon]|nr:hypothetical protein [Candidatus Diapherotrites archaeon]
MLKEQSFLYKNFSEYYKKNEITEPPMPERREFGIGEYGKKITQRHLSFSGSREFNDFLQKTAPFYVSYSAAFYEKPAARPMSAKQLLGADIVYEFDADDIKTECKKDHDSWVCPKCGSSGKGSVAACTECGSPAKIEQWFCNSCLGEAKKQVFKLTEFLENDLGFSDGIKINFSGSAGYHIHLRSKKIHSLKQSARIELLDYLTATKIDFHSLGFAEEGRLLHFPKKENFAWAKRLASGLKKMIEESDSEKIAAIAGMQHSRVKAFLQNKKTILGHMDKGILFAYPGKKNREFWFSLLEHVLSTQKLDIDRQTSIDLNKIIRVPDTIHGSTGLVAKTIPMDCLQGFKPFADALAFEKTPSIKVLINSAPKFSLGSESFGPFENTQTELPLHAAIYLVAKQAARLV